MLLPNLITIGTHKGGTSSLHSYLSQHPQISMSETKELHFFSGVTWKKGLPWYSSMFEPNQVVGESSVSYTMHNSEQVAERMFSTIPNAKLIYVVRDPIARVVSHFCQVAGSFEERRDFSEVAENWQQELGYLNPCMYHRHASNFLKYFEKERIHVLLTESLKHSPQETLDGILDFLEVDPFRFDTTTKLNVSKSKKVPNALTRKLFPELLRRQLVLQTWMPTRIAIQLKRLILMAGDQLVIPKLSEHDRTTLKSLLSSDVQNFQSLFPHCDYSAWEEY